jgi:antitoxin HicB
MMSATVAEHAARTYQFTVQPEADGGYFIEYPDLPGCMTQVDAADEIAGAAEEIRNLWIETALDQSREIPVPTETPDYSGKFIVRIPKSLHRTLSVAAKKEGVSLNQYAGQLLAQGLVLNDLHAQVDRIERSIREVHERLPEDVDRGLRLVAEEKREYRAE